MKKLVLILFVIAMIINTSCVSSKEFDALKERVEALESLNSQESAVSSKSAVISENLDNSEINFSSNTERESIEQKLDSIESQYDKFMLDSKVTLLKDVDPELYSFIENNITKVIFSSVKSDDKNKFIMRFEVDDMSMEELIDIVNNKRNINLSKVENDYYFDKEHDDNYVTIVNNENYGDVKILGLQYDFNIDKYQEKNSISIDEYFDNLEFPPLNKKAIINGKSVILDVINNEVNFTVDYKVEDEYLEDVIESYKQVLSEYNNYNEFNNKLEAKIKPGLVLHCSINQNNITIRVSYVDITFTDSNIVQSILKEPSKYLLTDDAKKMYEVVDGKPFILSTKIDEGNFENCIQFIDIKNSNSVVKEISEKYNLEYNDTDSKEIEIESNKFRIELHMRDLPDLLFTNFVYEEYDKLDVYERIKKDFPKELFPKLPESYNIIKLKYGIEYSYYRPKEDFAARVIFYDDYNIQNTDIEDIKSYFKNYLQKNYDKVDVNTFDHTEFIASNNDKMCIEVFITDDSSNLTNIKINIICIN